MYEKTKLGMLADNLRAAGLKLDEMERRRHAASLRYETIEFRNKKAEDVRKAYEEWNKANEDYMNEYNRRFPNGMPCTCDNCK